MVRFADRTRTYSITRNLRKPDRRRNRGFEPASETGADAMTKFKQDALLIGLAVVGVILLLNYLNVFSFITGLVSTILNVALLAVVVGVAILVWRRVLSK